MLITSGYVIETSDDTDPTYLASGDAFAVAFADLLNAQLQVPDDAEDGTPTTVGDWLTTVPSNEYPVITIRFDASFTDDVVVGEDGNAVSAYATFAADGGVVKTTETDIVRAFTYNLELSKLGQLNNVKTPLDGTAFVLCQFVATADGSTLTGDSACGSPQNPTKNVTGEDGETTTEVIAGVWKTVTDEPVEPQAVYELDEDGNVVTKTVETTDPDTNETVTEEQPVVKSYTGVFETLGDGTYVLIETQTPSGYLAIDPIVFDITATHSTESATPELKSLATTQEGWSADYQDGIIVASVVNMNEHEQLPSTGGMGTRLLYLAGAIAIIIGLCGLAYSLRKNLTETSAK